MSKLKGFNRFIVYTLIGYLVWLGVYQFFILPLTLCDEYLIHGLVMLSQGILEFLGFNVSHNLQGFFNSLVIDQYSVIWISPNCDGLSVVAVFSIVLFNFPGPVKDKIYFSLAGAVIIEAVNVFRIVCLSLIHRFYPAWLQFNHDYTFTVVVYGFVILIWWYWFKRLERKNLS